MTTLHRLNRLNDGQERVMLKEPDGYEWPPIELVLDHYEACLCGGPLDAAGATVAWIGRDYPRGTLHGANLLLLHEREDAGSGGTIDPARDR